jgi:ferredoxin-NADP reductase
VPPHRPGQFVTVRLADGRSAMLTRSYSISAYGNGRSLRISVKREGRASAVVHEKLQVGDELEVGAPRGSLVLEPDRDSPLVLASAGIGATPLLAMLGALAEQRSHRPVTWVHVARCGAEHALLTRSASYSPGCRRPPHACCTPSQRRRTNPASTSIRQGV